MSEEPIYIPPYPQAEASFTDVSAMPELEGRHFIVYAPGESDSGSYYKCNSRGEADGYTSDWNQAGVFPWVMVRGWTYARRRFHMLPLPTQMTTPTPAERDLSQLEIGKLPEGRFLLIKDREGKYMDSSLQAAMERSQAPIYKVKDLFTNKKLKEMVFELLTPLDAHEGGAELQEVICYAEAQRQEDHRRFMVKRLLPNQSNGYVYFVHGKDTPTVSRKNAWHFDKKELRRQFDDVTKAEIVIELLKPLPLSKMADFFVPSALELIKQSPKNELIRGFMLSKLKVMPPVEADTFEKIEQWVIWNVEKKRVRPLGISSDERVPVMADVRLGLQVIRRRMAVGRCTFSVRQAGNETIQMSLQSVQEALDGCDSWGDLKERLRDEVHAEYDDNADYEDQDRENTEDRETTDTNSHETVWRNHSITDNAIKAFLNQYLPGSIDNLRGHP